MVWLWYSILTATICQSFHMCKPTNMKINLIFLIHIMMTIEGHKMCASPFQDSYVYQLIYSFCCSSQDQSPSHSSNQASKIKKITKLSNLIFTTVMFQLGNNKESSHISEISQMCCVKSEVFALSWHTHKNKILLYGNID